MCFWKIPLLATGIAYLGGEVGGSGGVGEQTLLGVVSGHVPGGACCGVKVIVPMLVVSVVGVVNCVDQTIVEHLGWSCNTENAPWIMEYPTYNTYYMMPWCCLLIAWFVHCTRLVNASMGSKSVLHIALAGALEAATVQLFDVA